MKRRVDAGWTVPELRAESKRRGLPAWQCGGVRLRKKDLLQQLLKGREKKGRNPRNDKSERAQGVEAEELAGLADWELRELCLGVDRLTDPAASGRELVAQLVRSERSLAELMAGRKADQAQGRAARSESWVNPGRGLGVVCR